MPHSVCQKLLTPSEAAEVLRLPVRQLEAMRYRGSSPPYVRIGRRVLYEIAVLEQWLAGRRFTSTAQEAANVR